MGVDIGMYAYLCMFCLCMIVLLVYDTYFVYDTICVCHFFFKIGTMLFNVTFFCHLTLFTVVCLMPSTLRGAGNIAGSQTDKPLHLVLICVAGQQTI